MWWLGLIISVLSMLVFAGWLGLITARRLRGTVRFLRDPQRHPIPRIHPRAQVAFLDITADLKLYPNRLGELERRLLERHTEVQRQMQALHDRRSELEGKADRDDLLRKYGDDVLSLQKRAESLRRVAGVVWRTRAILLYRVHLAGTARQRPKLGALPSGEPAKRDLQSASTSYRAAAAQIRFYLDTISTRAGEISRLAPPEPLSADVDDELRADVAREQAACEEAHAQLRAKMDRLADDLTWLADHFAAMKVLDAEDELRIGAGADRILDEAGKALDGVDKLTTVLDPAVMDAAMNGLTEDVSRLEQAGIDARAEADARLEVERLVGGVPQ